MTNTDPDYKPDWVFFDQLPALTYAEKLELYQRDQELRFTSKSRAEYESRRAEMVSAAQAKK